MYVKTTRGGLGAIVLILFFQGSQALFAKTVEVEVGGDDTATNSVSTGPSTLTGTQAASPETLVRNQDMDSPADGSGSSPSGKRVRAPQDFSFYSFLASGFVVSDSEPSGVMGKVVTLAGDPLNYSQPSEPHIQLEKPSRSKVGDLLTVYHLFDDSLSGSGLNFQGSWAETRAVVQVEEIVKNVATVKIIQSFAPFAGGDQVRDYGIDVKRWKRAQTKKNLPLTEIHCYVAGGPAMNMNFKQSDNVVLTAGDRKGVVEGMVFAVGKKVERGSEGDPVVTQIGSAEVFYCGNSYSLARVTRSQEVIQQGFTAVYRP